MLNRKETAGVMVLDLRLLLFYLFFLLLLVHRSFKVFSKKTRALDGSGFFRKYPVFFYYISGTNSLSLENSG